MKTVGDVIEYLSEQGNLFHNKFLYNIIISFSPGIDFPMRVLFLRTKSRKVSLCL